MKAIRTALIFTAVVLSLISCDFLSQTGNMGEVMIPLFSDDGSRAVGKTGLDVTITGFTIRVFGPGMQPIVKEAGPTARYVNIYIPAGEDRHISVEAYFVPGADYVPKHVHSFIGRATVDLRPGRFTGVKFNMVAGATQLLVPDFLTEFLHYSDTIEGFSDGNHLIRMGANADLEISADGYIFLADYSAGGITYRQFLPSAARGTIAGGSSVYALAMDRDAQFDLDGNTVVDQSILYYSVGGTLYFTVVDNGTFTPPIAMDMTGTLNTILGMAVDPFTHLLYITGIYTPPSGTAIQALVVYEPLYHPSRSVFGRYVTHVTNPNFYLPYDVIVKDEGIFVLNRSLLTDLKPCIMKFDRGLNYIGGFGSHSVSAGVLVPSTASGLFYFPRRFFAQENQGLYIMDDSNLTGSNGASFDKVIHIGTDLSPSGWRTYPGTQVAGGNTNEIFEFFFGPS